ncbi:MAG: preprotein translocase subunit SecY [Deltaproteobacteria bacterium]|nr:preprotein translocase subunit SecY [Deltaproteobacteria bacterium]
MTTSAVGNIARIPELNRRILFTFGMLAVYRIGCAVPTPGIDPVEIRRYFEQSSDGGMFGLLNLFTGGAFEQLSIFSLGIMPYVSASIILQLLTVVIPKLEELKKEGEEGRRVITRWTRYGTVILAVVQGMLMATALEGGALGANTVLEPGWAFRFSTILTLTAGTSFIMWLGEQINERGIGNGISLVIFAGIVTSIPSALARVWDMVRTDQLAPISVILLFAFMVAVVGVIVYFERAQRRIPIQYARRVVGRRQLAGGMTYFPLRLNTSGVIPPIFASSLLVLPIQIAQWTGMEAIGDFVNDYFGWSTWGHNLTYVALIIFFAYFYTGVMLNPDDVAENVKKNGGYIPGIRPGKRTAEYIQRVMNRVTAVGALYLAAICVLPNLLQSQFAVPFIFGGTALLIVVGVAMDTVGQVEAHLVAHNYDSFVQGARLRGRGGR